MAKVLTAIPATESNVKTLGKKEPFRSVRNDFCTCSWLAWFQHEGSRRRAGWGIYLRNPTQLWEPTKLEIHRNPTYSNSHRISSSTVYFATSNTVCPCFTLRASDHLDDFVIEIGLVRLVRLVRLVPVSSAPSCQALLEAHLPSFSLANNRCLACLGTWNADSGYDSATSATLFCMWQRRSSHSICQRWKLLAKHGEVLSKFPNTWRTQGKACVLYAIYIKCLEHQDPAKFLGPNLHKKWTLCLWLETLGYLSCKPVRNLYSTRTLPIPTDTLKRCFVVFLFSRICCNSRQELPKTIE